MQTKFLLDESQMPKYWYNLQADLPEPLPPVLHPGTQQPVTPDDMEPLFPKSLIEQDEYDDNELAMALSGLPSVGA